MKNIYSIQSSSGLYWSHLIDWNLLHPGSAVLVWYQVDWFQSLQSSLTCKTDCLVVKAQTSSVSAWHVLSSTASPPQFNSKEPRLSFLVSTVRWSEELCLFLSIFSLYLQCSSYRGKKRLSLCFPSFVAFLHVSPSVLASSYYHCLILSLFFLKYPFPLWFPSFSSKLLLSAITIDHQVRQSDSAH